MREMGGSGGGSENELRGHSGVALLTLATNVPTVRGGGNRGTES